MLCCVHCVRPETYGRVARHYLEEGCNFVAPNSKGRDGGSAYGDGDAGIAGGGEWLNSLALALVIAAFLLDRFLSGA